MNIEFLNLLKSPQEEDSGRKAKNKGDEPIWVIYMEILYTHVCKWKNETC
jgi:hypothetical protein